MDFENLSTSFIMMKFWNCNKQISYANYNRISSLYLWKRKSRRGFINLIDTINCINIALNNPAKAGEFRVFNQFTDFKSVNDLLLWLSVLQKNWVYGLFKKINKSRKEMDEHYYNQKTSLVSLKQMIFDEK